MLVVRVVGQPVLALLGAVRTSVRTRIPHLGDRASSDHPVHASQAHGPAHPSPSTPLALTPIADDVGAETELMEALTDTSSSSQA